MTELLYTLLNKVFPELLYTILNKVFPVSYIYIVSHLRISCLVIILP